ncbi:MAG: glycosyltransferase family 2 protein [Pseudomonadota bacterium]
MAANPTSDLTSDVTWGVVATIRAPKTDILDFAAHYLDLGARRVFVYLDEDETAARAALKQHPKCRAIVTDDTYWKRRRQRRGRPEGHQHRQVVNATHCYNKQPRVDWLLHADVDEFLLTEEHVSQHLAALPTGTLSARVRPVEALQADPDDPPPPGRIWCKSFDTRPHVRRAETTEIYPTFGAHLNGGFLSHVAGKIFVRTGQDEIVLRIHNAFRNKVKDENPAELHACRLVHLHAPHWEAWWQRFRYRLQRGAYRPDLKGASAHDATAMTLHDLLSTIEKDGGEPALRAFYHEVCVATPDLRRRLAQKGHLHSVALDLARKRREVFGE